MLNPSLNRFVVGTLIYRSNRASRTSVSHLDRFTDTGEEHMVRNVFDDVLDRPSLFLDKEVMRHTFRPNNLLHRDAEIEQLRFNLVEALRGHIPSNMLLYGVTGAGKTAVTMYMIRQLEAKAEVLQKSVNTVMVNCRKIDTQYRVLAHLGNSLLEEDEVDIPFTGWPTDRVMNEVTRRMDRKGGVHVIILDEIDFLVKKSGNDLLYFLTNLNSDLKHARSSVIGISNDLTFTEYLDPRVLSRLGQHDITFSPYDAQQLGDILTQRAELGIEAELLDDDVIPLCSALAAQEHGDARRALDLLRVSIEVAEMGSATTVGAHHVRVAQQRIECDHLTPVIETLPFKQKLVLFSILLAEKHGLRNIYTGELYNIYSQACAHVNQQTVTQRRVTDFISNLDMLGLINSKLVNRGRQGRTKEINSRIPATLDAIEVMQEQEPLMRGLQDRGYTYQSRL